MPILDPLILILEVQVSSLPAGAFLSSYFGPVVCKLSSLTDPKNIVNLKLIQLFHFKGGSDAFLSSLMYHGRSFSQNAVFLKKKLIQSYAFITNKDAEVQKGEECCLILPGDQWQQFGTTSYSHHNENCSLLFFKVVVKCPLPLVQRF